MDAGLVTVGSGAGLGAAAGAAKVPGAAGVLSVLTRDPNGSAPSTGLGRRRGAVGAKTRFMVEAGRRGGIAISPGRRQKR
ncbi:MAG: hypothetical protein NT158_09445 [Cyanobacteria bacterium]|nr:hypothetical protein [Cyanobacteriota bacterium]